MKAGIFIKTVTCIMEVEREGQVIQRNSFFCIIKVENEGGVVHRNIFYCCSRKGRLGHSNNYLVICRK